MTDDLVEIEWHEAKANTFTTGLNRAMLTSVGFRSIINCRVGGSKHSYTKEPRAVRFGRDYVHAKIQAFFDPMGIPPEKVVTLVREAYGITQADAQLTEPQPPNHLQATETTSTVKLVALKGIVADFQSQSKANPRWDKANQLLEKLQELLNNG